MKKISFVFLLGIATMAFQSCGDSGTDNDSINSSSNNETANTESNTMADSNATMGMGNDSQNEASQFMVKAANGGMMEVELGSLAKDKATNPQVKEFAAMMVTDHSKANDELKSLAATKNFTLPATMDSDHRDHITDLSNKTGKDFDKAYMDMMVDDHKKDIDLFEDITKKDNVDADLKAFATKTLPVLKKHHEAAKKIHDALK